MKTVKCPQCNGNGEYNLQQQEFITPVKCSCDNGKITWSEHCAKYRKVRNK